MEFPAGSSAENARMALMELALAVEDVDSEQWQQVLRRYDETFAVGFEPGTS